MDRPRAADAQAGVFSRDQAEAAGYSPSRITRRLRDGRWRVLAGRGLVLSGAPPESDSLAWSVHLTWPDAVLSHQAAGCWWGFPLREPAAHVITTPGRRAVRGIRPHPGALSAGEVVTLAGGPRVTSRRRTALDCLAVLDPDPAEDLLAWLVTRGVVDAPLLSRAIRERFGQRGTSQLRRLHDLATARALSRAEVRLHRVLRRAGVSGWRANVAVRDGAGLIGLVDVLVVRERVVIEVDGWRAHGDRAAFERDRERQARLSAAGYLVVRLTWRQLQHETTVADQLRAVLAHRA